MDISEALTRLGGVTTRAQLVAATSRAEVDDALRAGLVVADARGRYASPAADVARREAHRLTGTVVLLSAALAHGWAVKTPPGRPQIAVPRNRKLSPAHHASVEILRLDLDADEVVDGLTTSDRTLLDCGRRLPHDEALAVFDSALRSGYSHARLIWLADAARGRQVRQMRELARAASPLAANPFESALRSIGRGVRGLHLRPQVPVYGSQFLGQPDLVDRELMIIVEADSFEWHGGRTALAKDARRYNWFVAHGWLVLRFSWDDVMFDPDYVREVITAAVALRLAQTVA